MESQKVWAITQFGRPLSAWRSLLPVAASSARPDRALGSPPGAPLPLFTHLTKWSFLPQCTLVAKERRLRSFCMCLVCTAVGVFVRAEAFFCRRVPAGRAARHGSSGRCRRTDTQCQSARRAGRTCGCRRLSSATVLSACPRVCAVPLAAGGTLAPDG